MPLDCTGFYNLFRVLLSAFKADARFLLVLKTVVSQAVRYLPLQVTTPDIAQIAEGSIWLLVVVGQVPGVPREITLDNGCK